MGNGYGTGGWRTLIMTRVHNRLTALKVARAKRPGMYADGGSLYLRVADGGSKQWMFRYITNGRLRDMGLGPVHTLSLAEAREKAAEARKLRLDGIDPIERKRALVASVQAANAKAMTFEQCAAAYIASHEAGWSNPKHRWQWRNSLAQHVYPVIGSLPVSLIDTALVMKTIEPLWTSIPETARRVRGRIESILDWARVSGYRAGENPARWRGHLDHLLPPKSKVRKVEHLAALPYSKVGAFIATLRQQDSIAAPCLEFIALTVVREGEAINATWPEIDLEARVWTIPPERMKRDNEHRVPLSAPALAVLKAMQAIRHSDYVFPGARQGRPLNGGTVLDLLKHASGADITVHGLRSSFRDWAAECTNFPREVAEMALAHAIPNAVEAAYRRGDLFEKRRKLMDAWAAYCAKIETDAGKVVALARARTPR